MEYRLNKYISASGHCSRREADRLIENGHVTLDGKRAQIGARVLPGQKVKVNGTLIKNELEPVYIAFNKPVGIVSTTDPVERNNIVDFISHEQRIFPIGRLDKDSQGLILLTNDGDIVNKILRAGNNHKKEYIVTVNRPITKEFLTKMAHGVPILDRVTRKCQLEEINPLTFKITLIQGLNRQIRRMCEYFNYEVTKLERIQVMNVHLGKLGQGNWRDLTINELEELFQMLDKSENRALNSNLTSKSNPKNAQHSTEKKAETQPLKGKATRSAKPGVKKAKRVMGEEVGNKRGSQRTKKPVGKGAEAALRMGKQRPGKGRAKR